VVLPTIGTKYLDTVAHTFLSVLHAVPKRFDCVLICNAANAVFAAVPRLTGSPVALNVDGIERKRKKWGPLGRAYYRFSELLATITPNVIVTDAEVIREYYRKTYTKDSTMIAYGADCTPADTTHALDQVGLKPRDYFLYVSRLEPENNAYLVVQAFEQVQTEKQLVIVGDAPYAHHYIQELKATRDRRIRFPGAIYGIGYRELQSHAYVYVHATEVGGTHPALIEAMGVGNCVLVFDTPENREVTGDCALLFTDGKSLVDQIKVTLNNPALVESLRMRARARAQSRYSWEAVTNSYERLFTRLIGG
jgi:glycosyltransferase involved in cell wall biosynthesis